MPIGPRTLTLLANRPDLGAGIKSWRVNARDARGRVWVDGPFKATLAEAEVKRDAVVFNLPEVDLRELLEFVQLGDPNTVAAFDLTDRDITEDEGEDHIYTEFAVNDRDIALTLAWWLDTLNTGQRNTIGGRAGFDGTKRGRIDQRFNAMVVVDPFLDATEEPV